MLLLRDKEEQVLTQHRNTKTGFHIRAAKHQEDKEKLKDQKESRVKCQGQLAKLDFSNAGLAIEHANDTAIFIEFDLMDFYFRKTCFRTIIGNAKRLSRTNGARYANTYHRITIQHFIQHTTMCIQIPIVTPYTNQF